MSKKREPLVIVENNFFNTFDTTEDIMEYMTSYGGKENAYLCAMTMAFTINTIAKLIDEKGDGTAVAQRKKPLFKEVSK
tara:strand:- start:95 stop:331 length:237 start_codon:yes stop_codon:yes gene_type:complete